MYSLVEVQLSNYYLAREKSSISRSNLAANDIAPAIEKLAPQNSVAPVAPQKIIIEHHYKFANVVLKSFVYA